METHKGRKPHLIIVVMQRQAPTPSHHYFSAGTNLQEAPTLVSYNWQLSSFNLIGKLQLPEFITRNFVDLLQISALFSSISFCSSLPYLLCLNLLWFSFSILTLSLSLFTYAYQIIYRVPHMTVCIPQGILSDQPWLFDFCLLNYLSNLLKNITICTNYSGSFSFP